MRGSIALALTAPVMVTLAAASADAAPEHPAAVPVWDVGGSLSAGALDAGYQGTGGVFGLDAHVRYRFVEFGGLAEGGGAIFGFSYGGGALFGGLVWRHASGFRASVDGLGGFHAYSGFGSGFFSSDPGVSAELPFVGGRGSLAWLFDASDRGHLALGLTGQLADDVGRPAAVSSYRDPFDDGRIQHATHHVGVSDRMLLLNIGVTYDLR